MNINEPGHLPSLSFAAKICLGSASLAGVGTMFLTTISNSLKVALYAGVGVFCIVLASTLLIWAVGRSMDL